MKKSVGIGSQISQISGLLFPTRIDSYCKIVKGLRYYGRYMDDTYVIHESKEYLGLAEQSKPSLYAGSISKPIPFLLSVKGAVPNISKIAQHKTLHVLM